MRLIESTSGGRRAIAAVRHAALAAVLVAAAATASSPWLPPVAAQSRTGPPASRPARGDVLQARVTRVADGDTFDARIVNGPAVRVRVEGIDCPEPGQPFSRAARNFTRQFAFDQTVTIQVLDIDRYNRLVARVTADGKDLSVELIKAGLAWHYTDYSTDRLLASVEQEARASRRGIWSERDPTPPWIIRRPPSSAPRARTETLPGAGAAPDVAAGPFQANVRSGVYHAAGCKNATCNNCTQTFPTEVAARAAGFRPAGDCLAGRGDSGRRRR